MKIKPLLTLLTITVIGLSTRNIIFAEESKILIRTPDTSVAIEAFKQQFDENNSMLASHGFDKDSKIGVPFAVDTATETDAERYYFPIINNGVITNFLEQDIDKTNGTVYWSIGSYFKNDDNLYGLADGNVYSIISDENGGDYAVADSGKIVCLYPTYEYNMEYKPFEIWNDTETEIVDVTKPLEYIDTAIVVENTTEENRLYEKGRETGKTILLLSPDNENLQAINRNDRILLPLRYIAEEMGFEVAWNAETKTASVKNNDSFTSFTIGESICHSSSGEYTLDAPAEIYNEKTYIPLRAMAESLGAEVAYNGERKSVLVVY